MELFTFLFPMCWTRDLEMVDVAQPSHARICMPTYKSARVSLMDIGHVAAINGNS